MRKNTQSSKSFNQTSSGKFIKRPKQRAIAIIAGAIGAMLASTAAMANGTADYFDVNGTTAGFGSPSLAGAYDQGSAYWTTDSTGQTGQTNFKGNGQLTFGAIGSDLAGGVFSVNMDGNQFTGIVVNSTSANITLTGTANAYLQGGQTWTVAAGSTLTQDQAWSNGSANYNGAALTLNGAGTINFLSNFGYNSGSAITESGTGVVNLQQANSNGVTNSAFTVTNGTLNFASVGSAGAFSGFTSGHLLSINGGTIDNTSGSPLTLSVGTGSYGIGGSFTFTGSSSLNLGTQGVALTVSPTITTTANTLTIGGVVSGASMGITKAGAGTLVLAGTNSYTGATIISAGTLQIGNGGATGSLSTSSSITDNGTLAFDRSDNVAQGGIIKASAIGGSGGITQLGGGTLMLSNSNTYSGPTTVMAGTLQAGIVSVANTSGAFGNNSAVTLANVSGAALDLNGFNTQIGSLTGGGTTGGNVTLEAATLTVGGNNLSAPAYAGVISSSGSPVTSLIKIGTGNLTLSGANTYTGATNVTAGTLVAANASALGNGSAVSVAQGAALNYVATANSPLTIGSLALAGGAGTTLGGSIGSTIAGAEISSSGAVTGSGAVSVNIYGIPGVTPAAGTNTYTLIAAPSGLTGGPTFSLGTVYNATNFTVGSFTPSATALQVGITAVSSLPNVYWYGGFNGAPGVWSASDGSANSNWSSAAAFAATSLTPGPATTVNLSVTSGATVTNRGSMTLGAAVSILGLVQSDSAAFTLLNDANGDALTIGTGGVTLNSGAGGATISSPIILGGAQTWTNNSSNPLTIGNSVANGGFLLATSTTSGGGITLGSGVTGTGGLTVGGTGITTLSNTNSYSGATNVNANATLALTGTVGSAGGTAITSAGALTESSTGIIAGTSSLTISGGITTLAGANSFTGATAINGGVLNIQNAGALTGTSGVSVAANAALQIQGGISTTTVVPLTLNGSGPAGNGALESIGGSGINTYTGPITLGSAATISADSAGGTLILSNAGTITGSGFGLTLTGSGTGSIAETIGTGTGSLTKSGSGTWVLPSANTYTGTTTVNQGTLVVQNNSPRSTSIVIAGGATLNYVGGSAAAATTFTGSGTLLKSGSGTFTIGAGGTLNFNFSPGAVIDIEGGAIQDSSFNAQWGGNFASMDINSGAAAVVNANNWIVDGLNNGASGGGTFTSTYHAGQSLTVGIANGNGSFSGTITNNSGDTLALVKAGTGTQILSGANSYTGTTSITGGTLALGSGGSLGSTAVTVSSGATLAVKPSVSGANNIIGGSLTLNSGSNFSMADGVASTTSITGTGALNGASLSLDLGGTSSAGSDRLTIGGAASLGGVNYITLNAFGAAGSATVLADSPYTIISAASGLGTPADFSLTNSRVVIAGTAYVASLSNSATAEAVILTLGGNPAAYFTGNAGNTALNATASGGTVTNFSSSSSGSPDFGAQPNYLQDVYFTATSGAGTSGPQTIASLGQSYVFNSVNFTSGSPAITLNDNTNTLTVNAGITDASANSQTVNVPVILGGAQTITNGGAGLLSLTNGFTAGANLLTIAGSGAVTISGTSAFTSSAGFTVNSGAGAFTISAPVTLGGVQTWTNNSSTAATVGGTVNIGGYILSTAGSGNISIAAITGGTGGLTAGGTGTTALTGTSAYTGATTVNSGATLSLTGTIGSGTGTAITSSGTFNESSSGIIANASTVTVAAGTTTLGGRNTYTGTTNVSGGTLDVSSTGSVIGSNVVKATAAGAMTIEGTVTVANNGAFAAGSGVSGTGTVIVNNGGILNIGNGSGANVGRTYIGGQFDANGTAGSGNLTINTGGTVNVAIGGNATSGDGNRLWMGPWGGGTNTLNFNGGTMSTARGIQDGGGGNSTINFNGGVLQYTGAGLVLAPQYIVFGAGGGTIDTESYTVTQGAGATVNAGVMSGNGALTKIGSGTLSLSAANTLTGGVNITGGELLLSGTASINSSSGITVNGSGASFVQTSSVASTTPITLTQGTVSVTGAAGSINVASLAGNTITTGTGTTTLGNLTFAGAGTLTLGGSTLNVATLATQGVGSAITVSKSSGWAPGTNVILGYSSYNGTNLSDFTPTGLTGNQTYSIVNTGTQVDLQVAGQKSGIITWGTAHTISADANIFTLGTLSYAYTEGGASATTVNGVPFASGNSTSSLGSGNVALNGFAGTYNGFGTPSGISTAYGFLTTGGAYVDGSGGTSVTLNNLTGGHVYATQYWVNDSRGGFGGRNDTLTSTGGNSVTVGEAVTNGGSAGAAGQYAIGGFTASGTAGAPNQSQTFSMTGAGGSIQLNAIQVRDVTPVWSGGTNGNWDNSSTSANLNFTGSNNYSTVANTLGFTAIYFADTDGFGNAITHNNITVGAGGVSATALNFISNTVPYSLSSLDANGITGGTALNKTGAALLTLSGGNTFTGGITISAGGLLINSTGSLGAGSSYAGNIINNGTLLEYSSSTSQILSGNISGTGALTKDTSATSTLTLSGTNSYSGATSISSGTLSLTGTLGKTTGTAISTAATFTESTAGAIVGTSSLAVAGGTTTLAGTNSYTGITTVNGGTLVIAREASLYNSTSANWTPAKITVASGATLALNVGGTGEFTNADLTTFLNASHLGGGTAATGFLTGSTLNLDTTNAAGGNFNYTGVIADPTGGGQTLAINKVGPNALTLTGSNTYSGGTTLTSGTLLANNSSVAGSTGSGAVNVIAGRLGGNGIIANGSSPVTINSGGVISPGSDAANVAMGTLTTGNQSWQSGGAYIFKTSASTGNSQTAANVENQGGSTTQDFVQVNGTLNIPNSATFTLALETSTALVPNATFIVANATGGITYGNFAIAATNGDDVSSDFVVTDNGVPVPANYYTVDVAGDSNGGQDIQVSIAPEPSSLGMLGFAALGLLRRRRSNRSTRAGV